MQNLPKTVGMVSLGCSKNRVDSENIMGILTGLGMRVVANPAEAELIVVNTCGFIESAKEESIDAIFEMAQYKSTGKLRLLLVTGCLTQRYGEQLKAQIPEVDGFVGVADYARLPEIIQAAARGARPLATRRGARFFPCGRVLTTPAYSAYVKISDGCDNRCAYCAIPLIRGGYQSRDYADILAECDRLTRQGATELTLIAQDTSRYGNDFPAKTRLLPDLLTEMNAMESLHWARVLYCYPDTVDERLLDTIARLPKVAKYLDLPLQHINDRLLQRMNRRGSAQDIRKLVEACRARNILVRTTMIVGFPGETDADFEELMAFIRWAKFGRLGAFTYSQEEGTPAASMPEQVDPEIMQSRLDRLMLAQQEISLAANETRVGTVCETLVEGWQDGHYVGRTQLEAPEVDGSIFFTSQKTLERGVYVPVRVTRADAYDLYGEAV